MIVDWIELHGSPVDVLIVLAGIGVVWLIRCIVKSQKAQNARLWHENKQLRYEINQLDKIVFTLNIVRKVIDGKPVDVIKESRDSQGNYGLDRDID